MGKFIPFIIFSLTLLISCSDNSTDPNGGIKFSYENIFPKIRPIFLGMKRRPAKPPQSSQLNSLMSELKLLAITTKTVTAYSFTLISSMNLST